VNVNGTLAGVAQYRGMFGSRVNVLVDGMDIANACSSNMDAPLHYSDADLLRSSYTGNWGGTDLLASLFFTDIEHLMNNYELRSALAGRMCFAAGVLIAVVIVISKG
jgi:hypothetical protein